MMKEEEKFKSRLDLPIVEILNKLRNGIKYNPNGEGSVLVDLVDKKVIGFHYGETHLAVALIIYGYQISNEEYIREGKALLKGFMINSIEYQKEPAYHWDFNNFAICVLVEFLGKKQNNKQNTFFGDIASYINELKDFILIQKDSNNATINWHPMRIYVNYCKHKWTDDPTYLKVIDDLKKKVDLACFNDGFYEDLLPKGRSFNFQYHVFTVATLLFLERNGIDIHYNEKSIQQVINMVDPAGDLNYLGRGINQIFAWGPAVYLLNSVSAVEARNRAWNYFESKIYKALENNNLIMNDLPGEQKNWWWDYHYSSVYFSHLALWLVLTKISDFDNDEWNNIKINESDSGVAFRRGDEFFVCLFSGRKHYLAEKGPIIANICSNSGEYVFKGALGPYCGSQYGRRYSVSSETIHNYCGLIQEKDFFGYYTQKVVFPEDILVDEQGLEVTITLKLKKSMGNLYFNISTMSPLFKIEVLANDSVCVLKSVGSTVGAYGLTTLVQSNKFTAKTVKIKISKMEALNETSLYQ